MPKEPEPTRTLGDFLDDEVARVIGALPMLIRSDQLDRAQTRMRLAFSQHRDKIAGCTPESVSRCIVLSALTGLMPGGQTPDVDLIPRWETFEIKDPKTGRVTKKKQKILNWQPGFRGYKRLAHRNGWDVDPVLVFAGDRFRVLEGSEGTVIEHEPDTSAPQSWATLTHAYVRVRPVSGAGIAKAAWLPKSRIQERRKSAQTDDVWKTWPLEQAMKTMVHYAGKRELFPCDAALQVALAADDAAALGTDPLLALTGDAGARALPEAVGGIEMRMPVAPVPEPVPVARSGETSKELFLRSQGRAPAPGVIEAEVEECLADEEPEEKVKKSKGDVPRLDAQGIKRVNAALDDLINREAATAEEIDKHLVETYNTGAIKELPLYAATEVAEWAKKMLKERG